jgi:hypothetical protein
MDQGAPGDAILLAELGPGRGTLMADALRATRGVPGFHAAMDLHLVEASPPAPDSAARWPGRRRSGTTRRHRCPRSPLFLVANEFFDALPIRQFQRARAGSGTNAWSGCGRDARSGPRPAGGPVAALEPPAGRHETEADRRDLRPGRGDRGRHRPPHRRARRRGAPRRLWR